MGKKKSFFFWICDCIIFFFKKKKYVFKINASLCFVVKCALLKKKMSPPDHVIIEMMESVEFAWVNRRPPIKKFSSWIYLFVSKIYK